MLCQVLCVGQNFAFEPVALELDPGRTAGNSCWTPPTRLIYDIPHGSCDNCNFAAGGATDTYRLAVPPQTPGLLISYLIHVNGLVSRMRTRMRWMMMMIIIMSIVPRQRDCSAEAHYVDMPCRTYSSSEGVGAAALVLDSLELAAEEAVEWKFVCGLS